MDPNACFKEIMDIRESAMTRGYNSKVERFLELVEDLRHWLAMGGFPPAGLTSGPDAIPGDIWERLQMDAADLNSR